MYSIKSVVPGGAMAPPDFGRSVNPISTKGGRLCPSNKTGTPGFSDLPTALLNWRNSINAKGLYALSIEIVFY